MKKMLVGLLLAAAVARADDAATRQAVFAATLREVDTGGQVLLYCNTDEFFQNTMARIKLLARTALAAPPANTNAAQAEAVVGLVETFLGGLGLRDVHGVAYSATPRADGLNDLKLFVNRSPATGALWRATGRAPHALTGVGLLPRDTVLANVQNVDLAALWRIARDGVRQIGGTGALAALDQSLAGVRTNVGVNVAALLGALGDEVLVAVQLSSVSNVVVMAGGPLQVYPRPSALLGFAVRDAAVVRAEFATLAAQGLLRPLPPVAGAPAYATAPLAAQNTPFPLAPVFVLRDDYLLLASQPDVAAAACAGHGLAATPEFQRAFAGLPVQAINGLVYLNPKFGKTVQLFQAGALAAAQGGTAGPGLANTFAELFPPGQLALVRIVKPEGVALRAVASFGGRDTVASLAVMPVGVLGALMVPGIVKGRQAAQRATCLNNLRQIEVAKETWALDKDKRPGAVPAAADLAPYLKGLPACPLGGTYTIGPVGQPPRCSVPEHALQAAPALKRKAPTTE